MSPNRHLTLSVWSLLWLAAALSGGNAAGQQAKSELVGTWTPIAIYTEQKDGTKFETFGPKPIGVLTFSDDGRFSLQRMRSDLPRFASDDRRKGTPKENQAIVQGSLSYFGTYTVDQSANTVVLHIEGSTFPNWNGKDQKRSFTLTGDKLTLSGIGTSGLPFQDELQRLK
jgi:Lipocalin-like domain